MARDSESKKRLEGSTAPAPLAVPPRGADCVTSVGVARTTSALSASSRRALVKLANSNAEATGEMTLPCWSGIVRKKMAAYSSCV